MIRALIWGVAGFQLLWAASSLAQSKSPDELEAKLAAPVNAYNLTAGSFIERLTSVASDFQIPMIIEWVNASTASTAELKHSWRDIKTQDIIEAIAGSQPGYEMRVKNGVVHISPRNILATQNFLLLKIKTFEVNHVPTEVASRNLRELVRASVSPVKEPGGIGGSLAVNIGEPEISLKVENQSVEDILDLITKISARHLCVVTFSDSFILTPTGFRRTETLWTDVPVSDDQQPVWDMFHWGDPMPSASRIGRTEEKK